MKYIRQETFIRGLHVYKIDIKPGDQLTCELDQFWMHQNPGRYSIAVYDSFDRKVFINIYHAFYCINSLSI